MYVEKRIAYIVSICSISGHTLTIPVASRKNSPTHQVAFSCGRCSIWSIRWAQSSFRLPHFRQVNQRRPNQLGAAPKMRKLSIQKDILQHVVSGNKRVLTNIFALQSKKPGNRITNCVNSNMAKVQIAGWIRKHWNNHIFII